MLDYKKMRAEYDEMAENNSIRIPICLCVDASYSMAQRIGTLNSGIREFLNRMSQNPLAVDATELCVISFGDEIQVRHPFGNIRNALNDKIRPEGSETRLGGGVLEALRQIDDRLEKLKGHLYYLPWLIIISDGDATDPEEVKEASAQVQKRIKEHKLKVKCLSMGDGSENLQAFTKDGHVDRLEDLDVMDFFNMLSRSVSDVSRASINYGEYEL